MNSAELRAAIARAGRTRLSLADAMGTTPRSLHNKLRGETQFKAGEIVVLARELGLDLAGVNAIFFDGMVNQIH